MFSLERIQYNFHVLWNFWNVRWFDTFWNHFTELFHQSCPIGWEKKNSKQNFEKSKLEASVVRFFFLPDGFIGHVGEGVATASFVLVGGVDWFNPPDGVAMNGVATRWLHRRPIYGAVIRVGSRGFQAETDSSVAFVSASAAFQVVDYSWTLNQSPKRRLVEKKNNPNRVPQKSIPNPNPQNWKYKTLRSPNSEFDGLVFFSLFFLLVFLDLIRWQP